MKLNNAHVYVRTQLSFLLNKTMEKIKLSWNGMYTPEHIYLCILKLNSSKKSFLKPHYYTQTHCPLLPDRNIRLSDQIMIT